MFPCLYILFSLFSTLYSTPLMCVSLICISRPVHSILCIPLHKFPTSCVCPLCVSHPLYFIPLYVCPRLCVCPIPCITFCISDFKYLTPCISHPLCILLPICFVSFPTHCVFLTPCMLYSLHFLYNISACKQSLALITLGRRYKNKRLFLKCSNAKTLVRF